MMIDMVNRYNLPFVQALFRNFLLAENISPLSIKNYMSDLRHFTGWYILFLQKPETEAFDQVEITIPRNTSYEALSASIYRFITIGVLERYVDYLLGNDVPVKTINRRLSTLRRFCDFCIGQALLKTNPGREVANVIASTQAQESIGGFVKGLRLPYQQKKVIEEDIKEFLDTAIA